MPNNVIITVYFTTTVREKIKLVFVKKDGKYRYQKSKTKLENKGELITEKEYDTSDMYESYKYKLRAEVDDVNNRLKSLRIAKKR